MTPQNLEMALAQTGIMNPGDARERLGQSIGHDDYPAGGKTADNEKDLLILLIGAFSFPGNNGRAVGRYQLDGRSVPIEVMPTLRIFGIIENDDGRSCPNHFLASHQSLPARRIPLGKSFINDPHDDPGNNGSPIFTDQLY